MDKEKIHPNAAPQMELPFTPTEQRSAKAEIEKRHFLTAFKRAEDDGRQVYGYAALFGSETDMGWYTEVIEAGAFDEALERSDCRALFNHKDDHLLARQSSGTLKLDVDSKGLKYEFASPKTQCGNDILEMMERGDLSQSSFAFTIEKETWEYEEIDGEMHRRRIINKIDQLYDVSPVTYPAYRDTTVAKRSWERFEEKNKPEPAKKEDTEQRQKIENELHQAELELIKIKGVSLLY